MYCVRGEMMTVVVAMENSNNRNSNLILFCMPLWKRYNQSAIRALCVHARSFSLSKYTKSFWNSWTVARPIYTFKQNENEVVNNAYLSIN